MKPADNLKYALLQQMSIFSLSQDQIYTLAAEIPSKWEMHGDLVILPQHTLRNKLWNLFGMSINHFDVTISFFLTS